MWEPKMLLPILLLNLVLFCLTDAGTDAKFSPKPGLEGLENLVEKLESRLRHMETRLEETETRLESGDNEMEILESRLKETEEFLRKEFASNFSINAALMKPSL